MSFEFKSQDEKALAAAVQSAMFVQALMDLSDGVREMYAQRWAGICETIADGASMEDIRQIIKMWGSDEP